MVLVLSFYLVVAIVALTVIVMWLPQEVQCGTCHELYEDEDEIEFYPSGPVCWICLLEEVANSE